MKAAATLFFQKGFHGTSVRDIAKKAAVNVSAINYYFKSKQGLLEYAVTNYYEDYLEALEDTIKQSELLTPLERLYELVQTIIQYKQKNYQLTCFIQRELTLDSVFVREMTVTYLAKENFYIQKCFFEVIGDDYKNSEIKNYLLMQLKGMLITPYILHSDWKVHVVGDFSHQLFVKKYVKIVWDWVNFTISQNVFQGNRIAH